MRKLIASYAVYPTQHAPVGDGILAGTIELELVPQGTLVERVRAGGAGLAAFYTPTGAGTDASRGKEERVFDGRPHVLEHALRGDVALVRAHRADRAGIFVDRVVRTEHPLDPAAIRALSLRYGKKWDLDVRERASGPQGIPPDLMAMKTARLLLAGEYVNLGVGLPTLVSTYIDPAQDVTLHSENGLLGFGALAHDDADQDVHRYNASGQLVRGLAGESFFDSCDAFAMARTGRVTTIVLGGFQVASNGDLANWNVPATGVGGIGGAMDLAAGSARIVVLMFHLTREGAPKLVERCTYPLTAAGCVATVVTDFAVIDVDVDGFLLRELAPGLTVEDVRQATGAPLRVAHDVCEMVFAASDRSDAPASHNGAR